jgi:hypothetical protein
LPSGRGKERCCSGLLLCPLLSVVSGWDRLAKRPPHCRSRWRRGRDATIAITNVQTWAHLGRVDDSDWLQNRTDAGPDGRASGQRVAQPHEWTCVGNKTVNKVARSRAPGGGGVCLPRRYLIDNAPCLHVERCHVVEQTLRRATNRIFKMCTLRSRSPATLRHTEQLRDAIGAVTCAFVWWMCKFIIFTVRVEGGCDIQCRNGEHCLPWDVTTEHSG